MAAKRRRVDLWRAEAPNLYLQARKSEVYPITCQPVTSSMLTQLLKQTTPRLMKNLWNWLLLQIWTRDEDDDSDPPPAVTLSDALVAVHTLT